MEIGEELGGGYFASVFKGIWKGRGGNATVAIKKVRFHLDNTPNTTTHQTLQHTKHYNTPNTTPNTTNKTHHKHEPIYQRNNERVYLLLLLQKNHSWHDK
jgi:Protein tyrosine and serine/threonine kinase